MSLRTRHQRCTVHKTANVLDKLPTSVQPAAKRDLRQIWTAPNLKAADAAIAPFAEKCGAKYDKAVACLTKDRDVLLTFHDVPAEHWDHLRIRPNSTSRAATCAGPTSAVAAIAPAALAPLLAAAKAGSRPCSADHPGCREHQASSIIAPRGAQHPPPSAAPHSITGAAIGAKANTMIVSLSMTWLKVKCSSPSTRLD